MRKRSSFSAGRSNLDSKLRAGRGFCETHVQLNLELPGIRFRRTATEAWDLRKGTHYALLYDRTTLVQLFQAVPRPARLPFRLPECLSLREAAAQGILCRNDRKTIDEPVDVQVGIVPDDSSLTFGIVEVARLV